MSFVSRSLPHRDGYRLAPNVLLRCGLASAIPPWQSRSTCTDAKIIRIPSTKGASIIQTQGARLDQADFDVLLAIFTEFALCEYAADEPEETIEAALGGLLIASGRQDGGKNRQWLRQSLHRLSTARICIEADKIDLALYNQELIRVSPMSETRYHIHLPNNIRRLFDFGFAGIHWHQRQQLSSPLGKWLHAFYSSHKRLPYRMGARLIGQLSGWSNAGGMSAAFPTVLAKTLDSLAEISGWKCEFNQDDERVTIKKPDDGVGGNASTAEGYREYLFDENNDTKPEDI